MKPARKPPAELTPVQRMCTEKRLYTTPDQARAAARGSRRTFKKPFRAYHCPNCGWWHVTSATGGNPNEAV